MGRAPSRDRPEHQENIKSGWMPFFLEQMTKSMKSGWLLNYLVTSLVEILSINQCRESESESLKKKHYFHSRTFDFVRLLKYWTRRLPSSASVGSRGQFDLSYSPSPSHLPGQNVKEQVLRCIYSTVSVYHCIIWNAFESTSAVFWQGEFPFTSLSSAYFIPTPKLVLLLEGKINFQCFNVYNFVSP